MRLFIWFSYLILFPIQILPQGNLQIADYILLFGVAIMVVRFFTNKGKLSFSNIYLKGAFYFTIYSLIVSLFYFAISLDYNYILPSFNYLYCFIFLVFIADLTKKILFFKITFWALIITVGVQLILFMKLGLNYDSGRYMIMFQNPNQLGFWGLIVILMFTSINQHIILNRPFLLYFGILTASFFVMASISQAAIIVLVLLLLVFLFLVFRKSPFIFILFFFGISFTTYSFLEQKALDDIELTRVLITRIDSDLLNENDNDNNLEGRNYNRIWENPEYLIFGAGESGYGRFGNDTNEIHSTFGHILFSYGFVGLILFVSSLLKVTLDSFRIISIIFLIFLMYTLTHNVLRWPLFWVLPYFMFCIKKTDHVRN